MPFVTEEIWQNLRDRLSRKQPDSIMIAPYPVADDRAFDAAAEQELESVIEIVRSIRNARVESGVEPTRYIEAIILAGEKKSAFEAHAPAIAALARVHPLTILDHEKPAEAKMPSPKSEKDKVLVLKGVEVVLPLKGMVDVSAEKGRLVKEIEEQRAEIERIEQLLKKEAFVNKAPAAVVDKERRKLSERKDKLAKLEERLKGLL